MRSDRLDRTDGRVLAILMTEYPITNVQIASQLGASDSAVRQRIYAPTRAGGMEFALSMFPERLV